MKRPRTPQELAASFGEFKEALVSSCCGFDEGRTWEARRLAAAVYVLVRDGGKRNKSLLTQLGLKNRIEFVASGGPVSAQNLVADMPLVAVEAGLEGAMYVPLLDELPMLQRMLSFDEWWDRDLIYLGANKERRLTRKKLVFAFRNIEGGAHFDEVVEDPNYIEIKYNTAWTFRSSDGEEQVLGQLEHAMMRQVAWELLESLSRAGL